MNPLTGAGALARSRAHGRFVHACRALTISAIALVAILLFPSGAFGAQKGINTDITWGAGSQTQTADATSDVGAGWTRITLSWYEAEPNQGHYDSSALNEVDNAI